MTGAVKVIGQADLPIPSQGSVITVGTFDGVHKGHQDVLAQLVDHASRRAAPSVVITFDPHPLEVVKPDFAPMLLTTRAEKLELFAQAGVSYVVVVAFTKAFAAMEAEDFVKQVLRGRFSVAELLVGYDHGFGRGRLGDINVLRELGSQEGFEVTLLSAVQSPEGVAVSSTAIRTAIANGDLDRAALGLGRPYSVSGVVVRGDQRGRTIGYPTLNLSTAHPRKLLPPDGVYAVRVQLPEGQYGGMLNLGGRPTFGDKTRSIETNVFDASRDWYGAHVRLDFVKRLRGVQPFAGIAELRQQLGRDEVHARAALEQLPPRVTLS